MWTGWNNFASVEGIICSKSLSIPLYTLFNKQLDSGCFPKVWKTANLVPVFKSDDRELVENYRGISLLCIISKILEKCVFSYVFSFFQPQIYHLQDGFVSGRSCVTSLLRSTHAFAKALDERKQVDTIFLDYSKAFDSISFNCLLKEPFDVRVRGEVLSWFRSYLMVVNRPCYQYHQECLRGPFWDHYCL